jgi:hypothetical protein
MRQPTTRNDVVRHLNNPDGTLHAERSNDGETHIVESNGNEPRAQWTTEIPATCPDPEVGQKRWTVPDDWDLLVTDQLTEHQRTGIYRLPDDRVARLHFADNCHLVDRWYQVGTIGKLELSFEPLLDRDALETQVQHARDAAADGFDGARDELALLEYLADNADAFEANLEDSYELAIDEIWETAVEESTRPEVGRTTAGGTELSSSAPAPPAESWTIEHGTIDDGWQRRPDPAAEVRETVRNGESAPDVDRETISDVVEYYLLEGEVVPYRPTVTVSIDGDDAGETDD